MANELKHGSVGTELTQAEWEAVGTHVVANQAVGDLIYADTTSQLLRLGVGLTNEVLRVTSGKPDWQATTFITGLGTITTGVWQGTDVGVAYGGTGVSTLTANGVLVGNGASAIGSIDMSTKGHVLIGDGSGNPQMLSIGTNTHVLTADSGETTGVKWAALSVLGTITSDIQLDANLDFVGPQTITTTSGALTVTPATDTLFSNDTGVVIGHTAQISHDSGASKFQILGTALVDSSMTLLRTGGNVGSPIIHFVKSRASAIGDFAAVLDNDNLGNFRWFGDDGTDHGTRIAEFHAEVDDAAIGTGLIGGAFVWQLATTSVGITEKMRLSAAGDLSITSGFLELTEMTAPGAGAANTARIYAEADGGSLTDLSAVFQDGTVVDFAEEVTPLDAPIHITPTRTPITLEFRKPHAGISEIVAVFPGGDTHRLWRAKFHDTAKIRANASSATDGPLPVDWFQETAEARVLRTAVKVVPKGD